MPSLGADMTEGTLLRWLVQPGDRVRPGDIVAEVDTTKAAIDVECFDEGTIGELLVPEGATVAVGTPLATIEAGAPAPAGTAAVAAQEPAAAPIDAGAQERPADETPVRATPLVRRLAEEAGVDLAAVHGSGPGGRVVRSDIPVPTAAPVPPASPAGGGEAIRASGYARRLAAETGLDLGRIRGSGHGGAIRARDVSAARTAQTVRPAPAPVRPAGLAGPGERGAPARDQDAARRVIAAAMTRSKRTIPHYYLSSTIDVDVAVARMREYNRTLPVTERIVASALLLCAAARAARSVPALNGYWIDDTFQPAAAVHLGIVVSLRGGGIMVPTVPDADTLTVQAMMGALRELVTRTRTQRLRSRDIMPATLTVTNLGDLGVDSVFGVIPVPQVAIVGFGAVGERPCVVDSVVTARTQVTATLAADHRATDGAIGARYLNRMSEILAGEIPQHLEE
ncbi:2-oxo acid dehydrogenase subunit E2 [Nocardia higoensis]|uniref:Dihydrolipoamide acetyltransferase component of pyruvate dehydrogenase complex n=2 Tax=Nocardia higoensis TaxID=228599 RepID=A0ABS0D7K8_9NOCA|nr:2-oxo acid dehydrogenase subunit E2 [Nocardia higoensis]